VCARLASVAAARRGDARAAYDAAAEEVPPFLKLFRDDMDAWLVDPLRALARRLRCAAAAADAAGAGAGARCLENCGTQLQKCFAASMQGAGEGMRVCGTGRQRVAAPPFQPSHHPLLPSPGNKAKKLAALDIVVTLFRAYFALNTLRLCKNLIAAVGSRQFPPFDAFPASQRVTYKYFTGRLAIFDEAYEEADADLSYAFSHCPRSATSNRARVAFFLVPVRLLRGRLPAPTLLAECGLQDDYGPIVEAVRSGSLSQLDTVLAARQWRYVAAGTYLLLEKLRPAVARRLVKKTAALHAAADPPRAAQLPLAHLAAALAWQGAPADDDAVECLVAGLVFRRYVKGYIAHKSRVLVLSKADPFPPLDTVALADPL
jgi:hypothetical protein